MTIQLSLFEAEQQLPLSQVARSEESDGGSPPAILFSSWPWSVLERDRVRGEGELHHILGRSKPRGWKGLEEPLKSAWPDVPMNCVVLSVEEHRPFSHISGRENKRRLLQGLLDDHGGREWPGGSGLTYAYWLTRPPFVEFLEHSEALSGVSRRERW